MLISPHDTIHVAGDLHRRVKNALMAYIVYFRIPKLPLKNSSNATPTISTMTLTTRSHPTTACTPQGIYTAGQVTLISYFVYFLTPSLPLIVPHDNAIVLGLRNRPTGQGIPRAPALIPLHRRKTHVPCVYPTPKLVPHPTHYSVKLSGHLNRRANDAYDLNKVSSDSEDLPLLVPDDK